MTITNEDNMTLMARYPDKYFDLAIVDPEYGIGIAKSGSLSTMCKFSKGFKKQAVYKKVAWDNDPAGKEYFDELFRVSKNQIVFGANFFIDHLKSSKNFLVWNKIGNDKSGRFSPVELIWTSFSRTPKVYDVPWIGFGYLNNKRKQRKIHPTEKPIELYDLILKDFAKPGDKILDTHAGSCSIAIACIENGFDLTACELDPDNYAAAMKRIQQHHKFA